MCNLPESHVKQIIERVEQLEKENKELKRRLNIYESPHIPSSKRIIKPKETEESKKPKKRGAPEGHKGATRKPPTPNRFVGLKPDCCPRCRRKAIRILRKHKKIIEDIEIVKTATQFTLYEFLCGKCKKIFTSASEDLPKEGNFGPNIISLWSMLYYYGTIPFERLSLISGNCFDMGVSQQGIHNAIYRVAGIFEPYYSGIERRILKSPYVRSDETSYSYNGEKWWLWNISTPKDTLVRLRDNRSAKVLKELFGEFLDAVLNSDCFRAYDKFKAREYQKCWAHMLTAAKDLAKHNEEGQELRKKLLRMYLYIRKAKKAKQENTPKTKRWKQRQKQEILAWIERKYESKAIKNLVLRMSKYIEHWFTCLKYPEVEPTNNGSEREIRKNVIARKISGCHRSKRGMRSREIMMSVLITRQKRGDNPFEFVRNVIEKYNSQVS